MSKSETQTDKHGEEQTVEQKLADILHLLNPPQQQYDALAYKASSLLSEMPTDPSIERALARYFELFAYGYVKWQVSYDYPRIYEYFYGAYLQAIQEGGSCLSPQLKAMLEQMTLAMIAYTGCENALISNDPKGLFDSAKRAAECGTAAMKLLNDLSLGPPLREPIQQYLQMNIDLWTGFKLCAEMYLAPLKNETTPDVTLTEIHRLLKSLEHTSRELASELRAHFSFAQRLAQAYADRDSDLRVKEGTLLLRASAYIGEDLVDALFKKCPDTYKALEEVRRDAKNKTKLPIEAVQRAYLPDFFATSLGQESLDQIIFELSTEDYNDPEKPSLSFTIHDGEEKVQYSAETFRIRLARFGTISVEFEIYIENASVSHVRALESLIGPHAGRFDFVWRDAPSDIEGASTNYVDHYLRSRKWLQSILDAMPHNLSFTVADMESVLEKWQEALCKLAGYLPHGFTEQSNEPPEQADVKQTLHQKCYLHMRDLAHTWIKEHEFPTSSSLQELAQEGNDLFPPGVRFGQLMDIAEGVLKRIKKYLRYLAKEKLKSSRAAQKDQNNDETLINLDKAIRHRFSFDCNTGWATVLLCEGLIIVGHDGKEIEPITESDYYRVAAHPEFKGFIIQSREARSGIDDWLFVATPPYRNLATIRSHETDAMYLSGNRTFLYLPDDPEFLTLQYHETALLMDDLRILVLSFNTIAKEQIKQLEAETDFANMERTRSYGIAGMNIRKSYDLLRSQRDKIEVFRTHAQKILDLIRSCTISRYQDHSDLLKEMIKESRLDDIRGSLEHNIADLDRFHMYLTERLKQKMDEKTETTQRRLSYLIAILTFLSALAIIPLFVDPSDFRKFLVSLLNRAVGFIELPGIIVVLLVAVLLGSITTSLTVWQKNKRSRKK